MYSRQDTINVGTTSTALLPAAANRRAIVISAPVTNRFTITILSAAALDAGINLYPSGDPVTLSLDVHGDIVTRAWAAISATAAQNVTIISVFD